MRQAPNLAKKSIVLVGLMGVGKSAIGRRLAKRLRLPFADADEEIETAADLSIPEIFERYGEDHFRDGERRVIARLIEGPRMVIATGGGAFIDPGTRALILARCTTIWLDADVEVIAERVGRKDNRPLLKGGNPRETLRALAEARNPIYAEAQFKVASGEARQDTVVDRIIEILSHI